MPPTSPCFGESASPQVRAPNLEEPKLQGWCRWLQPRALLRYISLYSQHLWVPQPIVAPAMRAPPVPSKPPQAKQRYVRGDLTLHLCSVKQDSGRRWQAVSGGPRPVRDFRRFPHYSTLRSRTAPFRFRGYNLYSRNALGWRLQQKGRSERQGSSWQRCRAQLRTPWVAGPGR